MADLRKNEINLIGSFPDNTAGAITPQQIRDFVKSVPLTPAIMAFQWGGGGTTALAASALSPLYAFRPFTQAYFAGYMVMVELSGGLAGTATINTEVLNFSDYHGNGANSTGTQLFPPISFNSGTQGLIYQQPNVNDNTTVWGDAYVNYYARTNPWSFDSTTKILKVAVPAIANISRLSFFIFTR